MWNRNFSRQRDFSRDLRITLKSNVEGAKTFSKKAYYVYGKLHGATSIHAAKAKRTLKNAFNSLCAFLKIICSNWQDNIKGNQSFGGA